MTDLSKTIEAKSDQLNSDDLMGGKEITIKITKVSAGSVEQPIEINYEGDGGKPYKPGKSMRRVLVEAWGADGSKYIGRSLTLYRDPDVKWAGMAVGGVRIKAMSNIDRQLTMALTASKGNKKPFVVVPLKISVPVKQEVKTAVPDIEAAGTEAAKNGVAAYKDWLATLTKEQKESIKSNHSKWSDIAKNFGQ